MLHLALKLLPVIQRMNWTFLHSPSDCVYITSDRPVTLVNPHIPPNMGGAGFLVGGVEVTCPVNAHLCMFLSWEGLDATANMGRFTVHLDVDEAMVTEINRRTAGSAFEAIYAPTRLDWLDERLTNADDLFPPPLVIR